MVLKIEYLPIEELKPYANNAKEHPAEQVEQIKKSIQQFGFDDPIGIWKDEIVEGHGRLIAALELGMDTVPVIRLDHLTDDQRRAYTLVHNKLTMNSDFNLDLLQMELDDIEIDMTDFGFESLKDDFDESNLDDDKIKKDVVISVNCGSEENYLIIKERVEELAKEIDGSVSVKMQ